jgi:pyrrolidone-carboxylate peptidase
MDEKKRILLMGFAPFGSVERNSSWQVTRAIRQNNIFHLCLPVDHAMAPRLLLSEIRRIKPDWVFGSGVHFDKGFEVETLARKEGHVDIALQVPWPMECMDRIVDTVSQIHPTQLSVNAGAWICELVAYWISRLAKHYNYLGGFVHVPMLSFASFGVQKRWWRKFIKTVVEE